MDDKDIQEYKQKIKGLTVKELHDILPHINKQKLPERHHAILAEISVRTGKPIPAAETPVSAPEYRPPLHQYSSARSTAQDDANGPGESASSAHAEDTAESVSPGRFGIGLAASRIQRNGSLDGKVSAITQEDRVPAQKWDLNKVLIAVSALFIVAGLYLLAISLLNLPAARAIRSMLIK